VKTIAARDGMTIDVERADVSDVEEEQLKLSNF